MCSNPPRNEERVQDPPDEHGEETEVPHKDKGEGYGDREDQEHRDCGSGLAKVETVSSELAKKEPQKISDARLLSRPNGCGPSCGASLRTSRVVCPNRPELVYPSGHETHLTARIRSIAVAARPPPRCGHVRKPRKPSLLAVCTGWNPCRAPRTYVNIGSDTGELENVGVGKSGVSEKPPASSPFSRDQL